MEQALLSAMCWGERQCTLQLVWASMVLMQFPCCCPLVRQSDGKPLLVAHSMCLPSGGHASSADRGGNTPLHLAAAAGSGTSRECPPTLSHTFVSPKPRRLHLATGNHAAAEVLLSHGAAADSGNAAGLTPLHIAVLAAATQGGAGKSSSDGSSSDVTAAVANCTSVVGLLVQYGADPSRPLPPQLVAQSAPELAEQLGSGTLPLLQPASVATAAGRVALASLLAHAAQRSKEAMAAQLKVRRCVVSICGSWWLLTLFRSLSRDGC